MSDDLKVRNLLDQAAELPVSQRDAFLDAACGTDLELRAEIASLLKAYDRADDFLVTENAGASAITLNPAAESQIGTNVGPYKLLERLGAGGMGTVYRAEQREPIRRTVAVKVIKLGLDTSEVIARFESERQVLARMDHPNIAKVLDAGTDDRGRPYFVMEYVPGIQITRFADENKIPVRDRLELFIQSCNAIAHAHSKGIIHRDIKSSNVLAYFNDGKPMVKVIDFGIAKAVSGDRFTDGTFFTKQGQAVGTYETMSPEQAAASPDIDTRTDVYALGVLLYQLLTGATPFGEQMLARAADAELRRIIREVDPPRPSTRLSGMGDAATSVAESRRALLPVLMRELRSELEWIPLKALRKERDRRYASPLQLAEEVRNYLDGKPLIAGPETKSYRLKKAYQRNRASILTAAGIALLILIGVTIYIRNIRLEQGRTAEALIAARTERDNSQREDMEAKKQTAIAEAVSSFQRDMLSQADPDHSLGEKLTVLQAMDAAAQSLDYGELAAQPLVEAKIRDTIGDTMKSLGQYPAAEQNLRKSVELRRKSLGPADPEIAISLHNLSNMLLFENRIADAEQLEREALNILQTGPKPVDRRITQIMDSLALLLMHQQNKSGAESLMRDALRIDRAAVPPVELDVARSLDMLAMVLDSENKSAEAQPLFRQAVDIYSKVLPLRPPDINSALDSLAQSLRSPTEMTLVEPLFRQQLDIDQAALPHEHPNFANDLMRLADLLLDENRLAEAEPLFRDALAIRRKVLPAGSSYIASSLNSLAMTLKDENKLPEAETLLRESLDIDRHALPAGHPNILADVNNLAALFIEHDRGAEAKTLLQNELETDRKALPADDAAIGTLLFCLGRAYQLESNFADAEPVLRDSLRIRTLKLGPKNRETKRSAAALADLLDQTNRGSEAKAVRAQHGVPANYHGSLPSSTRPASRNLR